MPTTKIYLELSEEIEELLADNNVSISDILENNNIEMEVTSGIAPYPSEGGARTKDIVTIILAGSASLSLITLAISRFLNTLYKKPHFIEYYENVEIRDANGTIILDKKGKPLLKKVKKHEFLETREENRKTAFAVNFGLKNGITIKFNSEEKEIE